MLQKIMPWTPEVAALYLDLVKSSVSSRSDRFLLGKIVVSFVDFLLENPKDALKDRVEIIREGLVLCLSFLMDPPVNPAKEGGNVLSSGEVDAVITGLTTLICALNTDVKQDQTSKAESIALLVLFHKIKNIQAEVKELFVLDPNSLEYSFPETIGIGFIDNVLDDLEIMKCQGKFIPFCHKAGIIHKELMSWRPFLKEIVEHHDLKDLWRQIVNVANQAERVISSCLSADSHIWYDLARLANVLEKVQLISTEVIKKVNNKQIQNMGHPSTMMDSTRIQPPEGSSSKAYQYLFLSRIFVISYSNNTNNI